MSQYIHISMYHNTAEIYIVSQYEMQIAIYCGVFFVIEIFISPSSLNLVVLESNSCMSVMYTPLYSVFVKMRACLKCVIKANTDKLTGFSLRYDKSNIAQSVSHYSAKGLQ